MEAGKHGNVFPVFFDAMAKINDHCSGQYKMTIALDISG